MDILEKKQHFASKLTAINANCQTGAQPAFRINMFNRIVVVCLELHEWRGGLIDILCALGLYMLSYADVQPSLRQSCLIMFVILNVYDAKNSNIGSVAICRHLTIWLALGIPKRIICYHCSNWTNRRNDLTGPEDPIYYSDRMIWLCVLLLLMVKGFDYWIGTKIPQIALDYLTMLNTGQITVRNVKIMGCKWAADTL